jgi:hypothetical protein
MLSLHEVAVGLARSRYPSTQIIYFLDECTRSPPAGKGKIVVR